MIYTMKVTIVLLTLCVTHMQAADRFWKMVSAATSYAWPTTASVQNSASREQQASSEQFFAYISAGHYHAVKACLHAQRAIPAGALSAAVNSGHVEIVQLLIAHGADVNEKIEERSVLGLVEDEYILGNNGYTPLHYACRSSNVAAMHILISNGALMQEGGLNKETPLHCAARNGDSLVTLAIINSALADATDYQCPFNVQDAAGNTPLMIALSYERISVAEQLIHARSKTGELFVDVHKSNNRRQTPLHYAISKRCGNILRALIELRADVDALDDDHRTPLVTAAYAGSVSAVHMLLAAGAKPNIGNPSPLRIAVRSGLVNIARQLIAQGAALDHTDGCGWAITQDAQHDEMRTLLQEIATDEKEESGQKECV